jgi:hypothetical protein
MTVIETVGRQGVMAHPSLAFLLIFTLAGITNAREYHLAQALPPDFGDQKTGQITLTLYPSAEGGQPLEVQQLANSQWRLDITDPNAPRLEGVIDTDLPLPLWAEISMNDERLATRAELNAPGDLTAEGEIFSKSGFRFPDNTLQTSAANTEAQAKVFGGSSSCPAGSSIRAIDAAGNVTCETDDGGGGGGGGVTQVDTGAGLSGGPITTTGTISVANNAITSAMIQNGSLGAADINSSQIQRRVAGTCPAGYLMTGINADGSLQCTGVHVLIPRRLATTIVDSTGNVGLHTSLALDASGHPVISYQAGTNDDLKLAHCNDANCAARTVTTIDSAGFVGSYSSLALDASGQPVISYYENTNFDLKLVHCNDANCAARMVTTVDSAGFVGAYTSLALDASGRPVISYYDFSDDALKLAHCNDANCATRTITTVDSTDDVGWYTSLALDASGQPVISYYDRTNDDLKLVHCNDANCAGGDETITTVDSAGDVGGYTSLALDASGHPVISYYDFSNRDLKLAHCNDANCATRTITTVDNADDVGRYSSLVLDASGQPVISYYDGSTNAALKLAHCNDANCAAKTITSVDSAGNVGQHTSLALDASGQPVISYYDQINGDLKLAR